MGYAITSKGQVTLPKRMRDAIGVAPGEEVEFRLNDQGEVVIEKAGPDSRPSNRFDRWIGFFGPGPTTDEIMLLMRGDPAEDYATPNDPSDAAP